MLSLVRQHPRSQRRVYDENTGLIYIGGGQYYDPVTGRLLTRGAGSNPYKPGAFDPAGMMVAPLALIGFVLGKKRKRGKWDTFIVLLVVGVVVGMSVTACGPKNTEPAPAPTSTPSVPPNQAIDLNQDNSDPRVIPEATGTAVSLPIFSCPEIPKPSSTPMGFDFIDIAKLRTINDSITETSGYDYYIWYKELWANKHWDWWKNHNEFSVWDLITLVIHHELGDIGNPYVTNMHEGYKYYKEAVVRAAYQWCEEVPPKTPASDPAGALNWLASYSESGSGLVKNYSTISIISDERWDSAQEISDALQNPMPHDGDEDWTEGWRGNQPYGVGNMSLFKKVELNTDQILLKIIVNYMLKNMVSR